MLGKPRYKVNLHMHTTLSDGLLSPKEALARYKQEGYDAVALTDHWYYGKKQDFEGMLVLSGGEYNTRFGDCRQGVFHIVGIGMNREPSLTLSAPPQKIIDEIHAAGGLAVLAHPAWSLNTVEQIMPLKGVDATEIYNSVSGVHESRRPDSSLIVDMLTAQGRVYPLLAADDTHYYDNDDCQSWIMVEAEECTSAAIVEAVRAGKCYATQGPEVHLWREGNEIVVRCSPCREIVFHSNLVWAERTRVGDNLTEARYPIHKRECFVRAEVTDKNGKRAWSQIIWTE
jgi:hypothetical protein